MSLETGNYISSLVATNPTPGDPKSQGDDHLRLLKDAVKNCFPGFTGTVFATGIDTGAANAFALTPVPPLLAYSLNMVVVFIPITSSTGPSTLNISGLGAVAIKTVAGTDTTVGDVMAGQPQLLMYNGTNFYQSAITKRYADALAFAAALPNQAGSGGRLLGTDGTTASWTNLINTTVMRLADGTDTTKQVAVNLAGITTGTTRTITMPNRDVILGQSVVRDARTSNTALAQADIGKLVDITSGTFTQTFAAAAVLASGWYIYLRNSGTGDITLAPNGAELIDGMASYIMYPGECRLIQCDGTTLTSIVINSYIKRYLAGAVWTKPPGYRSHAGVVCSAGSSGIKPLAPTNSPGAIGGPGGGAFPFSFAASVLGATEIIQVGAGGAAVTVAANTANAGGNSAFGTRLVVAGGDATVLVDGGLNNIGGAIQVNGQKLVASASGSGNSVGFEAATGSNGTNAIWGGGKPNNTASAFSGSSVYGGGAGGSINSSGVVRAPGISANGGAGGAAGDTVSGSSGVFPAGGGGATRTGAQSGAGANGYVDVWGER